MLQKLPWKNGLDGSWLGCVDSVWLIFRCLFHISRLIRKGQSSSECNFRLSSKYFTQRYDIVEILRKKFLSSPLSSHRAAQEASHYLSRFNVPLSKDLFSFSFLKLKLIIPSRLENTWKGQ